jgi:CRISPR/Cas system CMR-associated protein Cmr5 small subunit
MKNLEQMRAAHALKFWAGNRHEDLKGEHGSQVARELVTQLVNQGLLATIASAKDQSLSDRRSGAEELMLEVGKFLAAKERGLLPFPVNQTDDLVRGLTSHPAWLLQQATAEALAYLGYLKRFRAK